MSRQPEPPDPLGDYSTLSEQLSGRVIRAYSSSFGAATRLLGPRHRTHVKNIYALVRIADELVDGVTAAVGMPTEEQGQLLDQLESETEHALRSGYSSNPIIHAFAGTARCAGITSDLTRPFFSSMRADLTDVSASPGPDANPRLIGYGAADHAAYVHGSAEVVGLMCLRVFVRAETYTVHEERLLELGARRLGAAFQNINFLRDLGDDTDRLGRSYLSADGIVDDVVRDHWISVIRAQLEDAEEAVPLLPRDARLAVRCALRLFERLAERLATTPVETIAHTRVRVSGVEKTLVVLVAVLDRPHGAARSRRRVQ